MARRVIANYAVKMEVNHMGHFPEQVCVLLILINLFAVELYTHQILGHWYMCVLLNLILMLANLANTK